MVTLGRRTSGEGETEDGRQEKGCLLEQRSGDRKSGSWVGRGLILRRGLGLPPKLMREEYGCYRLRAGYKSVRFLT